MPGGSTLGQVMAWCRQATSHYLSQRRPRSIERWSTLWRVSSISECYVTWNRPNAVNKHDDVIKWKHFPRYWPFVRGIHRSPVNSPHKGQWRGALMISLICVWTNGWVNNHEAGDLRSHRAHYDVIVMTEAEIWDTGCDYGVNPLLPGRSGCDFKKAILLIGILRSCHDNALRWMPRDSLMIYQH